MARRNKKPPSGPKAAGIRSAVAQSKAGDFSFSALKDLAPPHGFTLRDEARNTNTAQHTFLWGRDAKLRDKPVSFVSGGLVEPLREHKVKEDSSDDLTIAKLQPPDEQATKLGQDDDVCPTTPDVAVSRRSEQQASHGVSQGGVENTGGSSFMFDLSRDRRLSGLRHPPPFIPDPHPPAEESDSSSSDVILFKGRANLARNRVAAKRDIVLDEIHYEIKAVEASVVTANSLEPPDHDPTTETNLQSHYFNLDGSEANDEDSIIADYIANMASESSEEVDQIYSFVHRDLGADHDAFVDQPSEVDVSSNKSTSSDEEEASGDDKDIRTDWGRTEEGTPPVTMDDETLARLLSKQEELGMGSHELLLHSHTYLEGGDAHITRRQSRQSSKVLKIAQGGFPSASAVADAFDDLDLMDWGRPSLQNQQHKGRRGHPVFENSDSELEANLQTASRKDREKKKERKLAREEMRAQGLLGKHANPDHPMVKYPAGMTLEDMTEELRNFLLGTDQTLQLPPMDKGARKLLHELAHRFKITSQSTGRGDQRRPTLCRTKYTVRYAEEYFEAAISRIGRRYFPRLDMKGRAPHQRPGGRVGRHSAVSYRDGEIVGASAPELGQDNKGRAILEKMGWSSGMALGSMDNKGILQPVAHVVKLTKAGLG